MRRRAYEIMDGAVPDKYSHFVEVFVALLVVANVIGIILESVPEIHTQFEVYFHARLRQHCAVLFAAYLSWCRFACVANVPFVTDFQTLALQQRV